MGLLDVLNGMQNGPHGQPQPNSGGAGNSGGMSPITMALIGLLAYKALNSGALGNIFGGGQPASPGSADRPTPAPAGNATTEAESAGGGLGGLLGGLLGGAGGRSSGGLADALPGGLGGLLGGAGAGNLLSGGLNSLMRDLQNSGHGQAAQTWVGESENQPIAPESLESAIGADTLDALAQQTGMQRETLLAQLSEHLPEMVNRMTPNGRLPTEEEASRMV